MYNKILIRYGELTLKGNNRKDFVNKLKNNLLMWIRKEELKVEYDRMFINFSTKNLDILQNIFGIFSYSPVLECESNLDSIKKSIKNLLNEIDLNKFKTFAINSRRNDKTFSLTSHELNIEIGNFVSEILPNFQVKLNNPDLEINIEVRKENTYIFYENIYGLGGMPLESAGKTLHLMSGGIDSPVAANLLQKRGLKIVFLNFITPPHTDKLTEQKIDDLINVLTKYQGETILYQINYTKIMNLLNLISDQKYKITLMRRSFYRIATLIAKKENIKILSTGESLGQVASQTLESLCTISNATDLEIFRPLICFDKIDTIKLAQKIKTYDISIKKVCETCELFAPKEPVTKPHLFKVIELEKELPNLFSLEKETCEGNLKIKKYKN